MTTDIKELRRRLDSIVQCGYNPYDVQIAIEALGIVERIEGQLSAQTAEPMGGAQNGVKSAETRANAGFEVVPDATEQPSLSDLTALAATLAAYSDEIKLSLSDYPSHQASFDAATKALGAVNGAASILRHFLSAQRQDSKEPLVWESITPCYTRFISEARYQKFSPEVRAWYRPVCEKCGGVANGAPK